MTVQIDSDHFGELYCATCETSFVEGVVCPRDGTTLVKLAPMVDPLIGRVLGGRFTVREKLGQGGMGAVYRAHQHSVDREVAIKVMQASRLSDREAVKQFLREAKLTSRLNHPNAVAVLDFGQTDDGMFFLVMELVAGITLDRAIQDEATFAPARVVRIGVQVCDALECAHAMQIIHRDLKPSNIMLLASGRDFVKVLDFGLAKLVEHDVDQSSSVTGHPLLGTPAFMPPERIAHGAGDGRGDLYSLGCVLHLLAYGRLPAQAQRLVARDRPGVPAPSVPPALARAIDRLIAIDPAARFQTAAETREALEAAATEEHLATASGRHAAVRPSGPIQVAGPAAVVAPPPGADPAPRSRARVLAVLLVISIAAALGIHFLRTASERESAAVSVPGAASRRVDDPTPAPVAADKAEAPASEPPGPDEVPDRDRPPGRRRPKKAPTALPF